MSGKWLPFRGEIHVCFAAESVEDAELIFDQLVAYAEHEDFLFELGSVGLMQPEDVIPGSPLDKAVTGA